MKEKILKLQKKVDNQKNACHQGTGREVARWAGSFWKGESPQLLRQKIRKAKKVKNDF